MQRKNSKTQDRAKKNNGLPGLDPSLHPRTRVEHMDQDYVDRLSPKEQEFLSKFNEEYYGAALAKTSEPSKWKEDLHSTKEQRKQCRDRNNAQNRDIIGKGRASGWAQSYEDNRDVIDETRTIIPGLEEKAIIKEIDLKKSKSE